VAHRRVFFRKSRAARESLRPGTLRLLPELDQRAAWERDYAAMRESMFFGEVPPFGNEGQVAGALTYKTILVQRGARVAGEFSVI
jgi:hypothetical protein